MKTSKNAKKWFRARILVWVAVVSLLGAVDFWMLSCAPWQSAPSATAQSWQVPESAVFFAVE